MSYQLQMLCLDSVEDYTNYICEVGVSYECKFIFNWCFVSNVDCYF